jgi:hypothetical protein
MGNMRSSSKSFRGLSFACFVALLVSSACGKNPELLTGGSPVVGPGSPGDACDSGSDCKSGLLCGAANVCVAACGGPASSQCGNEVCLPTGECSRGLGNVCKSDAACSSGLVCSALSRCALPCEPGEADGCPQGMACRDTGTCPNDSEVVLDPGAGVGGDSGVGGAPGCIDVAVDFKPEVPTVMLLIDRSGSMTAADGFGTAVAAAVTDGSYTLGECPSQNDWRWNVVRDVLLSPTKGIVKPLEERVRFGLSLYTSRNGRIAPPPAGPGPHPIELDPTKMCPELIEVPIALNNHGPMLEQFKCSDVGDDTPTGESLVAAAATLAAFQEPGPKVIVLATDGAPDNCECPDWGGGHHVPDKCNVDGIQDSIKAEVVATAKQIHERDGVTVHVINVSTPGDTSLQQHLDELATAGGGKVYPGFSPSALATAFEEIIDGVRSCAIDLDGEITEGKEASGTVKLDGEELELDGADGWKVNSPTQIELLGAACEAIKSGKHDISINFPCDSFKPVPVQ